MTTARTAAAADRLELELLPEQVLVQLNCLTAILGLEDRVSVYVAQAGYLGQEAGHAELSAPGGSGLWLGRLASMCQCPRAAAAMASGVLPRSGVRLVIADGG